MRGLALLAGILVLSASAFGQAMAEGALTHALSTATSTAVGKAMENSTNQMTKRVAGHLGQQTSPAVPRSRIQTARPGVQNSVQKSTAVPPSGTTAEPPPGGSLIASIQGAAPQPACASTAKDSQSKTDSASKPAGCPPAADSHPSMITLPAPK